MVETRHGRAARATVDMPRVVCGVNLADAVFLIAFLNHNLVEWRVCQS